MGPRTEAIGPPNIASSIRSCRARSTRYEASSRRASRRPAVVRPAAMLVAKLDDAATPALERARAVGRTSIGTASSWARTNHPIIRSSRRDGIRRPSVPAVASESEGFCGESSRPSLCASGDSLDSPARGNSITGPAFYRPRPPSRPTGPSVLRNGSCTTPPRVTAGIHYGGTHRCGFAPGGGNADRP